MRKFVSRAGLKLDAALDAFALDVAGWTCADFGANVGGFTDCLLQRGADKVYALDTGYGDLAWTLRKDPRVVVLERTNVLYAPAPQNVDLVVIDVAWTPQALVVPAAQRWLKPQGHIVTLLKPHYEWEKLHGVKLHRLLTDDQAQATCQAVCDALEGRGLRVRGRVPSVLRGKGGNVEYLLWLGPG